MRIFRPARFTWAVLSSHSEPVKRKRSVRALGGVLILKSFDKLLILPSSVLLQIMIFLARSQEVFFFPLFFPFFGITHFLCSDLETRSLERAVKRDDKSPGAQYGACLTSGTHLVDSTLASRIPYCAFGEMSLYGCHEDLDEEVSCDCGCDCGCGCLIFL